MKRIGYIYEKITDVKNIEFAIKKACEHKAKNKFIKSLLANKEHYALKIKELLESGNFKPLIIKHKKIREQTKIRDIKYFAQVLSAGPAYKPRQSNTKKNPYPLL